MRDSDRGSTTIWMLGLSLLLLLFGGLALDFWRGLAMQRELASVADSAALAAASGIDEVLY
ncbi:MAG: pilus assembly protein TadG-related protein, partial [Acidimicrobiia bacterium]